MIGIDKMEAIFRSRLVSALRSEYRDYEAVRFVPISNGAFRAMVRCVSHPDAAALLPGEDEDANSANIARFLVEHRKCRAGAIKRGLTGILSRAQLKLASKIDDQQAPLRMFRAIMMEATGNELGHDGYLGWLQQASEEELDRAIETFASHSKIHVDAIVAACGRLQDEDGRTLRNPPISADLVDPLVAACQHIHDERRRRKIYRR